MATSCSFKSCARNSFRCFGPYSGRNRLVKALFDAEAEDMRTGAYQKAASVESRRSAEMQNKDSGRRFASSNTHVVGSIFRETIRPDDAFVCGSEV
jgi:hypothetical protein